MYIYLANHHEALAIDDRKNKVSVSDGRGGVLAVGGREYEVQDGCDEVVIDLENTLNVKAAFTTEDGVRYTIIAPRVERKKLVSRPDPYAYILLQRIQIDELEKSLESANERIRKLEGMHQRRALNGIFKFKEV